MALPSAEADMLDARVLRGKTGFSRAQDYRTPARSGPSILTYVRNIGKCAYIPSDVFQSLLP